jgi:hypothetical protein
MITRQIINVSSITGKFALSKTQGRLLYSQISNKLSLHCDAIDIEFADVIISSCEFWAYAITPLLDNFTKEDLNQRINFVGLSASSEEKLRAVIKNKKSSLKHD